MKVCSIVYMKTHDFGLRYISPRRWCWRADDGSWRRVPKWSAKLYLKVKCGLSKSPVKNPVSNTIDAAMNEAVETFRVDLAGNYDFDREIRIAVDSFYGIFDTDTDGDIKAGEYQLPDGRVILLTNDVHMGLPA
jgi:hypothetical protein